MIYLREISDYLRKTSASARGRLCVITGARQCGKSTLAETLFPDYARINLDSPVERALYEQMTPAAWITRYPRAVLDEVQKLPPLIETIKAVYDRNKTVRYVLLGSSQILLLQRVRESLAGRVAIFELFPFSMPELMLQDEHSAPQPSRLRSLLSDDRAAAHRVFDHAAVTSSDFARAEERWQYFLQWGGMPALLDERFTDDDRAAWLRDYRDTYLQRDVADLARLERLEPFVRLHRAAALRAAHVTNYAELARLADVSPPTAKQFMRYLELSYQVALLPAYARNPEKRLSKQPKLHFIDPGVRRAMIEQRGEVTGAEFEGAVVAEVIKQCRTARLPVHLSHLRTADGREVDLLIETATGVIALECKLTRRVGRSDFRHLRGLETILDKPLRYGLVVSQDRNIQAWDADERLWSVPAAWLLT